MMQRCSESLIQSKMGKMRDRVRDRQEDFSLRFSQEGSVVVASWALREQVDKVGEQR